MVASANSFEFAHQARSCGNCSPRPIRRQAAEVDALFDATLRFGDIVFPCRKRDTELPDISLTAVLRRMGRAISAF